MKKLLFLFILSISLTVHAQSSFNSSFPAGGLKLSTSLNSTLQNIRDKSGTNSILRISTQRIALGSATGTGLINLPDSTNASNGISFGTGTSNLYRSATNSLCTDGFFTFKAPTLTGSQATSAITLTQTANTTGSFDMLNIDLTNTASGSNSTLINAKVGGAVRFRVKVNGDINMGANTDFGLSSGAGALFRYSLSVGSLSYPVASAVLECTSTTKGFLPPRMTTTQKNAIASPANGLLVFDTTLNQMSYWNGTIWVNF